MIDAEHTAVTPLSGISPEQARDIRARAWAFVFQCWQEKQMAAEPDSCNYTAIVRNTEEVSHVEQRHDRSSDDHLASGTLAATVSDSQKYRESIS